MEPFTTLTGIAAPLLRANGDLVIEGATLCLCAT